MRTSVIRAVFQRELAGYFSTPTGYVFIAMFVFLSAIAAFWQESFFATNLANLDQLNAYFPYLLIFLLPSISMTLWAEEKRQGTEELLLTLPASDFEIVTGKYFAAVAIYTVCLLFSLSHIVVLKWLGAPDPGLMMTTYFGYWLMGASLLAVAMLGSMLTDNLTVAFILGALFVAVPVFLNRAGAVVQGVGQRLLERLSVVEQFRDLAGGVVTASAVAYFAALAVAAFYANVALLGRRRWPTGPHSPSMRFHVAVRFFAALLIAGAVTTLASHVRARVDATSEQIHSLSADTKKLLAGLDPKQPVFIYAYVSPEVPRAYLDTRRGLISTLREFDAVGGEGIHTRIIETMKYTPQAREAQERYNVRPFRVPVTEESSTLNEIFLGLVFTCGSEEFTIPFLDRGLPVEYELMRSIRVVSRAKRKKIGILTTQAKLFGGFDFQRRQQSSDWSIVAELKKQYEVAEVNPDIDYPADLDTLVAPLPYTLTAPQVQRLTAYAKQGKPLLVLVDPMPAFNLGLAPAEAAAQGASLAPEEASTPRTSLRPLLDTLGVTWQTDRIIWDDYNPHPQLKSLPKEVVFIGKGFNPKEAVTSGLQEVVLIYTGELKSRSDSSNQFSPLLETTVEGGTLRFEDLVQRSLFGVNISEAVDRKTDKEKHVVAARITGGVNAVIVADIDIMGEQFFEIRRRGAENLNFDNVTFLLNAVDQLSGDTSFIALRKRRPKHRTLEAVEARTRQYDEQRLKQTQEAEAFAEARLREAQTRLDRAVAEIQARNDLDEQAKQIMISNIQSVENRRLTVARQTIDDEKQRQIENSRAEMESSIRGIQNTLKLLAVALPPVPAFLVFLIVSARRLARERIGTPLDRLVEEKNSMKESLKTAAFVASAVALSVAAIITEPERRTAAIFSETGQTFFPNYTDPKLVKTIEVVEYDEATASARPFQVAFEKGRWILPANYNYVIDVGDRLVKTAGALVELKKETVVTESVSDHAKYGVIDPLDPKNPSLTGRGKRVTLRDAAKAVLADFVLGKAVEGKTGYRYLRAASDKRVYAVKTDADPSARFADWVNAGLLRIAASTIRKVAIVSYSIDEQAGRLTNVDQVQLTQENGQWQMAGAPSFKKNAVQAMAQTLDSLKIADVRPKPPSMAEGLKTGQLEMSLEGAMSMRQRGYFLTPQGRLMANEGEMVVETANGLAYVLRFGEVATSTGETKTPNPATGDVNRYLFVTVSYDAQRAAKYGDSSGAGERLARDLNNRFADWYYVIRGSDFQRLRLKKKDLI